MNIETLQEYINDFNNEIIDSGFKRDLGDYIASLPASQSNIVTLREISNKVLTQITKLYSGDLPNELDKLLPKGQIRPFTEVPFDEKLNDLIKNKEITQQEFFNQLTQTLTEIQNRIQQNITEINKIEEFLNPYSGSEIKRISEDDTATLSIIFKEANTISSLKQFTKNLVAWNKTLPVYHQLVKGESPKDITIKEVQNGSIDLVINLNIDVGLNLANLFKVGFQVFASYLAYKKMLKPIIESYHGNEKLIKQEEEREKLLLANIGEAIDRKIKLQHQQAKKHDKSIDGTSINKKAELVTELIASHIVKGNDFKLLAIPEVESGEDTKSTKDYYQEKQELQQQSLEARKQLREIPQEDRTKLLEMYGDIDVNDIEDQ